jgi:hypothetical protein
MIAARVNGEVAQVAAVSLTYDEIAGLQEDSDG